MYVAQSMKCAQIFNNIDCKKEATAKCCKHTSKIDSTDTSLFQGNFLQCMSVKRKYFQLLYLSLYVYMNISTYVATHTYLLYIQFVVKDRRKKIDVNKY